MFNIWNFPTIINHLKSISKWFKPHGNWIGIFCIYCDDATRKANPTDGHFHISTVFPYGHCFRCSKKKGLYNLLVETGFTDLVVLNQIPVKANFTYHNVKKLNKTFFTPDSIQKQTEDFAVQQPKLYKEYKEYIYKRLLDINPINFFLSPGFNKQYRTPTVDIHNSSLELVTSRTIYKSNTRYINTSPRKFYYFQNIISIYDTKNIVITEGAFDLINLFNYSNLGNNNFYISISGSSYQTLVNTLVSQYLLIGKYIINIVFDNNIFKLEQLIRTIKSTINELNPEIKLRCYLPTISKDVSDLMALESIYSEE